MFKSYEVHYNNSPSPLVLEIGDRGLRARACQFLNLSTSTYIPFILCI